MEQTNVASIGTFLLIVKNIKKTVLLKKNVFFLFSHIHFHSLLVMNRQVQDNPAWCEPTFRNKCS